MHGWLQLAHVREFWDDGDRTPAQVQRHSFEDRDVRAFVFVVDGAPAGYLQACPVGAADDYAAFRAPAGETWGIDLFIGEVAWLGRGLAVPILRSFLDTFRADRPVRFLIDPEVRNARARHVYRKAGFRPVARLDLRGQAYEILQLDMNEMLPTGGAGGAERR